MRSIITTVIVAIGCLAIGLFIGAWQSDQLKATKAGQLIATAGSKLMGKSSDPNNDQSRFESYDYPTIKWQAQELADGHDAIAQLWTTYDPGPKTAPQGVMKYKLTLFKATNKDQREVQIIDGQGFKLMQFNANDFHGVPSAPDVVEARDSVPCSEDLYKKARDYSVK